MCGTPAVIATERMTIATTTIAEAVARAGTSTRIRTEPRRTIRAHSVAAALLERAPHAGFSTIFQYESFLMTFPVSKLPMVASTHPDSASLWRRAGQKPLGDAHIAADPVSIITVVDVREALEARH